MVERDPGMTAPMPPVRRHRGPTRRQIIVRRVVALALLTAGLGFLLFVAAIGVGAIRERAQPPPPVVAPPPPPKPLKIIFPEGFTRKQMAARVAAVKKIALTKRKKKTRVTAKAYLAASASSNLPRTFGAEGRRDLEGFLFPATYEFLPKTTAKQLVARQLEAFRRNWAKVDLKFAKSKNLTPYDVLIIASMVEREAIAPDERPLVAAVIYNRLREGMTLGIDATIRYGLDIPGTEPLHESELEDPNPYNTRIHAGLPPGPIANPGLASIQAAAHPAEVDYLFFVRKPDKIHHFFTADEDEFYAKSCEYGFSC